MRILVALLVIVLISLLTCGQRVDSMVLSSKILEEHSMNKLDVAIAKLVASEHQNIVRAIIQVESKGDTLAISKTGDYGIMQVNKRVWHSKFDFNRIHELEYGIYAGYSVFSMCMKQARGNTRQALRLYNGSYSYADRVMRLVDGAN
jgi:hypothetical protein